MDSLLKKIFYGENNQLEFKLEIPEKSEKYLKTIVAFANGTGGKIIFGIEDGSWKIAGFEKSDIFKKIDSITNSIYDSCEPVIMPNVTIQEINKNAVIVVEISSGMQKPYYIKSLGIDEGTFIRVSGTTRRAQRAVIQELILEGSNRSFDQLEAKENISVEEISDFCDRMYKYALKQVNSKDSENKVNKIGINQLLSWKLIIEKEGKYYPSNGYLLLDEKQYDFDMAVIQCAVFKGVSRDIFIDKKEFGGSIYKQIENAYHFILQHIKLGSRIDGIYREDIYELPVKSIREVIANAVCHRNYLTNGKIQVALYDDRLEVTSPGFLDRDITIEKMMSGLSKIRNKGIANAFAYMNIIEGWGSGIPKLFKEANEYGLPTPKLIDMENFFRVEIYRKEWKYDNFGVINPTNEVGTNDTKVGTNDTKVGTNDTKVGTNIISHDEDEIIRLMIEEILKNPNITQKELSQKTKISIRTVKRIMSNLQTQKRIERVGSSRSGKWILLDVQNDMKNKVLESV